MMSSGSCSAPQPPDPLSPFWDPMLSGMQLPVQTLTRTLADPWEDTATVADLVTIAQKAEVTGHDFVGVCDHVAIPDNDYAANMTTTWYDTVATLSYLAAHTSIVNLLSVVWIAAYRHPLQTAKSFGTLDHHAIIFVFGSRKSTGNNEKSAKPSKSLTFQH